MTRNRLKLAVAAVAAVIMIILVVQNTQETPTRILFITVTMPRAVLLLITFLLGLALGLVGSLFMSGRSKK